MKIDITVTIDTDHLRGWTDTYLATLWHLAQANPAAFGDPDACAIVEHVGREIIRRFLAATAPDLWNHQGVHAEQRRRGEMFRAGETAKGGS